MSHPEVINRYRQIQDRIADACRRAKREPSSVRLLVVTKSFSLDAIQPLIEAGHRDFAESYVQEGVPKVLAWRTCQSAPDSLRSHPPLNWHLVGHLQTNKAKAAVAHFDLIQSVDSDRLARRLNAVAAQSDKRQRCLVQVRLASKSSEASGASGPPARAGVLPEQLGALLAVLQGLTHLTVEGLMTIGPARGSGNTARAVFRQLAAFSQDWRRRDPRFLGSELSMGMSDDFELAIEEGATMVRIGTAIMGQRKQ